MANPAPTINQINAFNATQGTTIDFNIIGGTELVRSNRIYIYDLSDNSLICTHLYVSTESIHELPANTDSNIVYESGKSSANFVNGAQYYAQIQTYTDTAGTEGGSGLSVAKMFWCLIDPTLTITTIPSTISTTSYNVSATYTDTSASVVSNIIQQYQFNLYSAVGSLLQSSGVVVGSGEQQGTSARYDISYNFSGLSVGSSYYVIVDVTTTQGMNITTQSNTFTVSIETPTLGEATVVNNACDGYISVISNLSGEYGGSASGEIATFETDSVNDVSSLKVTLTPQQSDTPWIGTDHDTTPYLHRAMPTQSNDYNRESGVIVGGTVAWNQLVQNVRNGSGGTISVDDDVTTISAFTARYPYLNSNVYHTVVGHKYYACADVKYTGTITENIWMYLNNRTTQWGHRAIVPSDLQNTWIHTSEIYAPNVAETTNSFVKFQYNGTDYANITSISVKSVQFFDLTQMFGSTIADYIYSLEQATPGAGVAWFRKYFPEDYYPYSANTLQSVQATAHKTYDGGGNVLGNYALDSSLTLRGIPKLDASNNLYYDGDTYESDGTVTRKYGIVDLGTLTWQSMTTSNRPYFYAPLRSLKSGSYNVVCPWKFKWTTYAANAGEFTTTQMSSGIGIYVYNDSTYTDAATFKTAMSGVYLVYELATPTTEQAQGYTNPQIVDPDGTEEYVTANYVPVGHDSTYSLVCPISGYDEVNVNVVGVNLFDKDNYNVLNGYIDDGVIIPSGSSRSVVWMECKPNTTYAISRKAVATNERFGFGWTEDVPAVGTSVYGATSMAISTTVGTTITRTLTTGADAKYLAIWLGWTDRDAEAETLQLELGSTATAYEPYQGQTYTADLPQTVYGGTVDLVSGDGTDGWYYVEFDGSENWVAPNETYFALWGLPPSIGNNDTTQIANWLKGGGNAYQTFGNYRAQANGAIAVGNTDNGSPHWASVAEFKAFLAENPLQVSYKLATPQTYQLTPQQIQTFVGQTNVWSDEGEVEVTYNIPITNLLVKRQDVADVSGTWLILYSQPITQASDMDFTFIDFTNQYGKTYKYALVPLLTQTQSGVEVEVEGGYTVSDEVQSIFDGVFIADSTGSQKCKANVGYGNVDMNQVVGSITPIGAKYPVVITNSKNQYHNGSISGTIVPDDYYFNGNLSRIDMVNKRDELEQFLTNKRAKIIKDWNGKVWLVMIMDNISCTFNNNYGMGIVNFSTSWVEVGDPTNQEDLQATGLINIGGV